MRISLLFVAAFCTISSFAQQNSERDTILAQLKVAAKELLIDKSYPNNLDTTYGGYLSAFTYDFKPTGDQDKMIVTQARHIWSTSKASKFYNDTNYVAMARHGFHFLRDKMWDKE